MADSLATFDQATRRAPYAHGGPACHAVFKQSPDDFVVREVLGFDADGEGPHWLVHVEKRDTNTLTMLSELARCVGVERRAVGYSGLKDRFALTRQYVTVPATVPESIIVGAAAKQWRVLNAQRHRRKLRIGSHRHNRFRVTLRDLPSDLSVRSALRDRLDRIERLGVPNYFGVQRFGNDLANLRKAQQLFADDRRLPRQQQRFAVSAARALLFNAITAHRVDQNCWQTVVNGDALGLNGSASWFDAARLSPHDDRLARLDVHPTGAMWGRGEPPVYDDALAIEQEAVAPFETFTAGLAARGLKHERRALRQKVECLDSRIEATTLTLEFELIRGGFATSVVRELVTV